MNNAERIVRDRKKTKKETKTRRQNLKFDPTKDAKSAIEIVDDKKNWCAPVGTYVNVKRVDSSKQVGNSWSRCKVTTIDGDTISLWDETREQWYLVSLKYEVQPEVYLA